MDISTGLVKYSLDMATDYSQNEQAKKERERKAEVFHFDLVPEVI